MCHPASLRRGFLFSDRLHLAQLERVWETVFYKNGDAIPDFALFPREGSHKPTLCVWELVPVWYEQQAWVRFLTSPRDEAAAQAWINDCFTGIA